MRSFRNVKKVNSTVIIVAALFLVPFNSFASPPLHSQDLTESLLNTAYRYRLQGKFESAETVLRSGMKILALESDGDEHIARLKIELARVFIRKAFHANTSDQKALLLYREAETTAVKTRNKMLLGKAIYGVGYFEFKLGPKSWDKALVTLKKSLALRRETGDTLGVSQSLFTIGVIHQRRGETEAADKMFDESLKAAQRANSKYMEGENERHIGYQYYLRGDLKGALPHFFTSLEKRRSIGYRDGEIFALITIGQTYEKLERYSDSVRYLKEALSIAKPLDSRVAKTRIYASLGQVFYNQKKNQKALISLKKARELAHLIGYTSTKKNVEELLLKIKKK